MKRQTLSLLILLAAIALPVRATLVEEDRVIAAYYGRPVGEMIAISSEPLLLNWEKVGDSPVIANPDADWEKVGYKTFDPYIWKKDGDYQSLRHGHVSAQDINLPANREVVLRNVKGKEHPWFSLPQGVSEADRLQSRRWTPGR